MIRPTHIHRYNGWRYIADGLDEGLTLESPMPEDRAGAAGAEPEGPPKKRKTEAGGAVPAGDRTFREYYRCGNMRAPASIDAFVKPCFRRRFF